MKIVFLNPPFLGKFSRTSRSPAVTKGGTLYYPFWLAYAVGVAEKAGHVVQFYDAPADSLSHNDIEQKIKSFMPDLIVVESSTPSIYNDIEVLADLKKNFPDSFTVIAGTHPSAEPEETLELNSSIDAAAIGEYDYIIRDLAQILEDKQSLDKVDGLAYRDKNSIKINKPREKITDLDEIPFVSSVYKKHLNYKNYFFAAANYPMMMIITGRGCPHRCFFCVYPQVFHGRKYRARSAENVAAEFEYIIKNFPEVKEIGIEDDTFAAKRSRVRDFCKIIISKKIKIKWYCNVRGDLDYETLRFMKKAGCRLVTVGFESASQDVLNNINKGETVERYYQFAKDAKKAGILVHGCIMVGNPGDSKETLKQGYEFAKKINCDSMQFYPLYVYPGTEAFQWARDNNYISTLDYAQWLKKDGTHNCILNLPGLSADEMVELCDYYLKKYHLRPGYILQKMIQAITKPSEGYRSLKSAKVFFTKFFFGKNK